MAIENPENNLSDKSFWDEYLKKYQPRIVERVVFADIFEKYLTPNPTKTALEVGCAGGNFLCYLAKKFKYQAFGVDYSDGIETTKILFQFNKLPEPTLYKTDFFKWHPGRQFEIVCSFGFVEHFENFPEVIKKHADLVSPGGMLIITMPHFAHVQYFFHWILDRENLRRHNTKIMNLKSLRKALTGLPFEIKYLNYYQTIGFWTEKKNLNGFEQFLNQAIRLFCRLVNGLFGYNHPNPLISPHIVLVARKKS
ncbi:methyltransferase domain-containing protein [bacterium]|nr:MAG: methyltransferase domain-containing protein [bacterium]